MARAARVDVVGIQAIAHAVADVDAARPVFEEVLGFRVAERGTTPRGDPFVWMTPPGVSGVGWLLLAPGAEESALGAFLAGPRGPGVHHLRLGVRSMAGAPAALPADSPPSVVGPVGDGVGLAVGGDAGRGMCFELYTGSGRPPGAVADPGGDTLGIIAINHVAHAHPDRDALGGWYEEVWGFTTVWRSPAGRGGPSGEFATRVLESPTEQMRVEAIAPTHGESFIQKFLDERGPAPHHVTVEVADWGRAVSALERHGIPFFGQRDSETNGVPWSEAFIHPRHTHGVLFQFFWQAEPGVWI